jgi:hypothetical protein
MTRQKVEFPANIPTQVELDGIGTLQANQRGDDEYRYFLKNDRIMWVPPAVHAQLEAAQANNGDVVTITKGQAKARAPITWKVQLCEDEPGAGYSNAPSPAANSISQSTGAGYREPGRERRPYTHPVQPLAPAAPAPPRPPQPAAQLAADAPELPLTAADRMAAAMRDAIDLWRGAAQYAPDLHWDAGDVRALAATLFIDGGKR